MYSFKKRGTCFQKFEMKISLFIFLILIINHAVAQNRIFYNAVELKHADTTAAVKKIKLPWGNFGSNVVSVNADGSRISVCKKDIWGIEKDNVVLRFNEGIMLELLDTNSIIIYKTYARHPVYYFSENLNSKAIILSRRKLMQAFDIDRFPQVYKQSLALRTALFYTDDFRVKASAFNE